MRYPLVLSLALATSAGLAASEVWQVDQPAEWWNPRASHHGKHALGGLALGALSFEAADLVTDDRAAHYAVAIGAGVVVGFSYEAWHARDGRSFNDPVDALYVVAGAAIGAVLADYTGQAVSVAIHRDGASLAWERRW